MLSCEGQARDVPGLAGLIRGAADHYHDDGNGDGDDGSDVGGDDDDGDGGSGDSGDSGW